jgi:osmotically-inducible protein OsmY
MRVLVFLIFVITSSGCAGLMVGGGSSASSTAGEERAASLAEAADTATTNKVKQKFAADAELSKPVIYVSTSAGMVRLSGSVASYAARENAEKLAMATDGVKAVENKITVEFSN